MLPALVLKRKWEFSVRGLRCSAFTSAPLQPGTNSLTYPLVLNALKHECSFPSHFKLLLAT